MTLGASALSARGDEPPTYERDIRPIFARRCNVCHSQKNLADEDISAGLALDTYESALAGTREHKVIAAGNAAASALAQRLDDPDEERRMPLSEKPLAATQRNLIRRWIDAGAPRGIPLDAKGAPAPVASQRPARRIVRALDVIVPTEAKAPPGFEGVESGGPIQLALKVGPLPVVTALAFRRDGRQLAVGTFGAVVLWDLDAGRPALILGDVPGQVHALTFDRDGKRLAVGAGLPARSGLVRVYALPEGSIARDFPGHRDIVSGLAFSPDGRRLASASFDQTVRLWNLSDDQDQAQHQNEDQARGTFHGHSDFVYDVAFTNDGASLLSVSKDRSAKRIDASALKERRTYSDHNEDVLALAVHPSGTRFVTAGNEPQIRWWGLDDEKPAMKVGGHSGPVHQLSFSGDGKRLISAGADGTVRLWDGSTGVLLRTLPIPGTADWQYAATLSDDGRLAAAGGWDGQVRLWDADAPKLRATLLQPPAAVASNPGSAIDWLVIAPSGFAAASEPLRPLLRWRIAGREVACEEATSLFLNPGEVAKALRGKPAADPFAIEKKE
jgi:hypothetical protein